MKSLVALALTTTVLAIAQTAKADTPRIDPNILINGGNLENIRDRAITDNSPRSLAVQCTSSGQVCNNRATYSFYSTGNVVQYAIVLKAPTSHCSAVSYTVYDSSGSSLGRATEFLNAGQSTYVYLPRHLARGRHTFSIGAEGTVGGCNAGTVYSWGVDASVAEVPQ